MSKVIRVGKQKTPANACPHCKMELKKGESETDHMAAKHPEIVEKRMELAGFRRGPGGEWIDRLTEGIVDA